MLSYIKTCMWLIIGFFSIVDTVPWVSPSLEILDELRDAEIYQAVVTSMNEWQRKQNMKKHNNNRIKREESNVCFPELGCFEAGYLDMLPNKPEEINTKFILYPGHLKRRTGYSQAEVPFTNLKDAYIWAQNGFNNTLPTKVLIHGFGSDCTHIWIYEMRSALMAVDELNVICVDWENGAILPNYVKATANTRIVGKQLAILLKGLVENNGLSLKNTHLIGFSLGAHVAGFAGAELKILDRITGLDPAGPLFESQDPRLRLDQTDAAFVDVIHSNGENLILGGLGSYQPMGHVDFYPNGGRMQKGCSNLFVGAVSDIIWSSAVEGRSLCNHRRAYKFFTDSVSPRCHFPAFPCETYENFLSGKCFPCTESRTCGNMGYYADRSKGRGQLYLITRDEEPFCAHQYHIKIETSPSQVPILSYGKIQITLVGDSSLNETFMMTRKEDEEMKLGDSISRIVVPHPILSEPTKIEILYTAYSGWLSSGLTQWRMDKITLSDSFGKVSSVCKKNLILESGVAVLLPLYPGECNLPKEQPDDRDDVTSKFNSSDYLTLNSVVDTSKEFNKDKGSSSRISFQNAIEIFNIPWRTEKENKISDSEESESSRAFNTRIVTIDKNNEVVREIVEPILRPHSSKNARSQDLNKKTEISEPILAPTTTKYYATVNTESSGKNDFFPKLANNNNNNNNNNKEINYNFYDLENENDNDWRPATNPPDINKWKRDDNPRDSNTNKNANSNPFEMLATTVQFLPQRLAKMFEQAERYARETLLPFVSTYTPKFISDFISPREPKYLPLNFEEATTTISIRKNKKELNQFDPPPKIVQQFESTTPYTHIQKIKRKGEDNQMGRTRKIPEISRKVRDDVNAKKNILKMNLDPLPITTITPTTTTTTTTTITTKSTTFPSSSTIRKGIYIDLPVFENKKEIKYIPLRKNGNI